MTELYKTWVLALGLVVSACASDPDTPSDPIEPVNRFVFNLNQKLDRNAALPAATFYRSSVPAPARDTFHNIVENLGGPVTVVNDVFELQFKNAGIAAARFVVNSTIGLAGIFDIATGWGLPGKIRDFGETMGGYGLPPGPYLVLPLRGSADVRDFAGDFIDGYFTPFRYAHYDGREYIGWIRSSLGSMDTRSNNLVTYSDIERASVDYYASMRAYYLQRRERQVEDRASESAELPDF